MKPGRKLDALVAEKVMGWVKKPVTVRTIMRLGTEEPTSRDDVEERLISPDATTAVVPHFSTDIAAAWEVVERLNQQGFRFEYVLGTQADSYATFIISGLRFRADTATAPHAICLAALKAVGWEG